MAAVIAQDPNTTMKKTVINRFQNPFVTISQYEHRIIVKMTGTPSDSQVEEYLEAMRKMYDDVSMFTVLYDTTGIDFISPKQVKRQAEFMRSFEDRTKLQMKRAAVVVNTRAFRMILNTLFALRPPSTDLEVFNDKQSAKSYLKQCKSF